MFKGSGYRNVQGFGISSLLSCIERQEMHAFVYTPLPPFLFKINIFRMISVQFGLWASPASGRDDVYRLLHK
jgi:hypothetical protein